jgi:hypothetical protein
MASLQSEKLDDELCADNCIDIEHNRGSQLWSPDLKHEKAHMWGIAWLLSIPKKDFSTIVNTKAGQWRVSVNCALGGFRCWMARLKSKSHRLECLIMRVVYWYHFSYKTHQEKPVTITWIGTWEAYICSLAGLVKNLWAEEEYFLQPYWAPWQDFLMLVMTWHEFWCWICAGEDTRNAGLACPRPSRTAISKWTSHLSTWLWKQFWADF